MRERGSESSKRDFFQELIIIFRAGIKGMSSAFAPQFSSRLLLYISIDFQGIDHLR